MSNDSSDPTLSRRTVLSRYRSLVATQRTVPSFFGDVEVQASIDSSEMPCECVPLPIGRGTERFSVLRFDCDLVVNLLKVLTVIAIQQSTFTPSITFREIYSLGQLLGSEGVSVWDDTDNFVHVIRCLAGHPELEIQLGTSYNESHELLLNAESSRVLYRPCLLSHGL